MTKKCPKCEETNTEAYAPRKMFCKSCGHEWTPYKHSGKKMKIVGDGIFTQRKKFMPGAKTKVIGDGLFFPKKRIKKY